MSGRDGWWPEKQDEEGPRDSEKQDGEGPRDSEDEPERDRRPAPPPRRPGGLASLDRPKVASRYSWFVGLAFAAIALVAVLNAVRTDEGGLLGADRDASRGLPLPEFAAPNVLTGPVADANIDQDDCESARNPCPADQVRTPACEVETEGAIRVCDEFDKPLALSFWFTRGGDCTPTQDAFDQVAGQREDVNFLSVNVLDERDEVAEIVRRRGWRVPVGHDTDGAVSNVYGVGVCPSILLAYPGGILHAVEIEAGNFTAEEIDGFVDELLAASLAREPRGTGQ